MVLIRTIPAASIALTFFSELGHVLTFAAVVGRLLHLVWPRPGVGSVVEQVSCLGFLLARAVCAPISLRLASLI